MLRVVCIGLLFAHVVVRMSTWKVGVYFIKVRSCVFKVSFLFVLNRKANVQCEIATRNLGLSWQKK